MYDLETERVAEEIRKRGARRVLIQLPDGLRPTAFTLANTLARQTDADILLSGDSCYGACDLALSHAEKLDADLIVHYGHSQMIEDAGIPVVYIEARVDFDVGALLVKALPLIEGWSRIGLTATIQHAHKLGEVAEALRQLGHEPVTGPRGPKTSLEGQVTGCDYTSAISISYEVDGHLFVGAGRFHPLGLSITTGKPVVMANPYIMSAEALSERDVMRLAMKRMAAITVAKEAKRFGIVVSLKPGQYKLDEAKTLRSMLEERGCEAVIICLDEAGTNQLGNFTEADAFVIAACPRIALDGIADIGRPLLTMNEAWVTLGEKKWEDVWGKPYFT